jgi:hypothetical protein
MTNYAAAVAALLACSACAWTGNDVASTGEFVTLRQGDTLKIERFAIDERRIRAEITNADAEVDSVQAWLGPAGAIDSLLITELDGDARWTGHAVFHDSSVSTRAGTEGNMSVDTARTSSRAMPWYELALLEAVLRTIKLGEGGTRTLLLGNYGNQLHEVSFTKTGDTILVADNRRLYWLAVDRQMSIRGGRSGEGDRVVRRSVTSSTRSSPPRAGWHDRAYSQLGKCPTSSTSSPLVQLTVEIDDQLEGRPTNLRSDRKGPYSRASSGVHSLTGPHMQLATWGQPAGQDTVTGRYLTFDLTQPVPSSGSKSLGVISDPHSAIAVFYRIDAATDSIFNPSDMAVGEETRAARLELMMHIGGTAYQNMSTLSFGPFSRGYCEEGLELQDNVGSTAPILKRVSSTTWTVTIPHGSAGRLWYDIEDNRPAGVLEDRGLYAFSASFRFTVSSP